MVIASGSRKVMKLSSIRDTSLPCLPPPGRESSRGLFLEHLELWADEHNLKRTLYQLAVASYQSRHASLRLKVVQ